MTLKELLALVDVEEVLREVATAYPKAVGDTDGYRLAIAELAGIDPTADSAMSIVVCREPADPPFSNEPWWHVFGRQLGDEQTWALDIVPWSAWLAMEVGVENCDLTPTQMVAHCLWEMTFHGYDQASVQGFADRLDTQTDEIKALLDKLGDNPTDEQLEAAGLHVFRLEDLDLEDEESDE